MESEKALERANQSFKSLPVDDRPLDLVNSIFAKYASLLKYLCDELQADKSEARNVRHIFSRAYKGATWILKEEWVQGRVDEIKEMEKVVQE